MRMINNILDVSSSGIPLFQMFLLTCAPCTSPFILSMFPNCQRVQRNEYGTRFLVEKCIHIFEVWMTVQLMYCCCVWFLHVIFEGIVTILTYIQVLQRWEVGNNVNCSWWIWSRLKLFLINPNPELPSVNYLIFFIDRLYISFSYHACLLNIV